MSDKQKAQYDKIKERINNPEAIMKAKGHSLWLMPTGKTYDKLSGLIKRLAKEYNAPPFEPHVTLLGETMESEDDILIKSGTTCFGTKSISNYA